MRYLVIRNKKKTLIITLVVISLLILYGLDTGHTSTMDDVERDVQGIDLDAIIKHKEEETSDEVDRSADVIIRRRHDVAHPIHDAQHSGIRVAIGCAITSFGISSLQHGNFTRYTFFTALLPTFCSTASPGYDYHIYLAFDKSDVVFNNLDLLQQFHSTFQQMVATLSCDNKFHTTLHFVRCDHDKSPAWAQNDAMMEAYLDGADYFYRVNDDTTMLSTGWTALFIAALKHFYPPRLGVVGPDHSGGKTDILTYDFVHRTHVDIFGFYYPRTFPGWYSDSWISMVYGGQRTAKLSSVHLTHDRNPRRYPLHGELGTLLADEVKRGADMINKYLEWALSKTSKDTDGRKVISISLYGSSPDMTFGALRNAHLTPIYFPGWTLRIYLPSKSVVDVKPHLAVHMRVIHTLQKTKAQLVYVDMPELPPDYWRHLVADDNIVDYFIVRSATTRLSARDSEGVRQWMASGKPIHVIRDHFSHMYSLVLDDLWGGKPDDLKNLLSNSFKAILLDVAGRHAQRIDTNPSHKFDVFLAGGKLSRSSRDLWMDGNIIEPLLYPYLSEQAFCNDGIRCHNDSICEPFLVDRVNKEFLGQQFSWVGHPYHIDDAQGDNLPARCETPEEASLRHNKEYAAMKKRLKQHEKLQKLSSGN